MTASEMVEELLRRIVDSNSDCDIPAFADYIVALVKKKASEEED